MRVNPSWEQIDSLLSKPPKEVIYLTKEFDLALPNDWEIYIRPFMNGDQPDIVLLNPKIGIVFIEVVFWMKDQIKFKKENISTDNNKTKEVKLFYSKQSTTDASFNLRISNPISSVNSFKNNLQGLYVPSIGEAIDKNAKLKIVVRTGLYFPFLNFEEINKLLGSDKKLPTIWSGDKISLSELKKIIPSEKDLKDIEVRLDWVSEIKYWLNPPFHKMEEGTKITLNDEQKRHVDSTPGKQQRLKGVVGSGKTLVIAQRAANIASKSKRVLIIHFNITLMHYIKHHMSRSRYSFDWKNVEIKHFHNFCRNYLLENSIPWPAAISDVPDVVIEGMRNGLNRKKRKYDAILIDEGQDFQEKWYDALKMFLSKNGETLFVADDSQNIYERDLSWTGIGRWRSLKKSYRLPFTLVEELNRFNKLFLKEVDLPLEAQTMEPTFEGTFDPHLIWFEHSDYADMKNNSLNSIKWLIQDQNKKPSDIVLLVANHDHGKDIVDYFKKNKIESNNVFDERNASSRSKKLSFIMNDERLKICTIHSFKGWELPNVVILIPPEKIKLPTKLELLLYVAMSRARENLIIHNVHPKFKDFGKDWPHNYKVEKFISK